MFTASRILPAIKEIAPIRIKTTSKVRAGIENDLWVDPEGAVETGIAAFSSTASTAFSVRGVIGCSIVHIG